MFSKRGEEHYIKLVAGILIILIILAGILILFDTFTQPNSEKTENEIQIPEFVVPQKEEKTLQDNIETLTIPTQLATDCQPNEVYDINQKRCIFICANCTNQTVLTEILRSFIAEKQIELGPKRITFSTYIINDGQELVLQPGDSNITGYANQKFVTNKTYEADLIIFAKKILPLHTITQLKTIQIVTDGRLQTLSSVEKNDDETWKISLDITDSFKTNIQKNRLSHTLIKTFGEIYFFNNDQINRIDVVNRALTIDEQKILSKTCPNNYFSAYGCMKNGAYLDNFYKEFWSELYKEWIEMDNPKILYSRYDNTFHKIDSTTDPLSDMLNAWTYFIITDKPTTESILDKKVLFFYEYPELLRIRDWIRANLE